MESFTLQLPGGREGRLQWPGGLKPAEATAIGVQLDALIPAIVAQGGGVLPGLHGATAKRLADLADLTRAINAEALLPEAPADDTIARHVLVALRERLALKEQRDTLRAAVADLRSALGRAEAEAREAREAWRRELASHDPSRSAPRSWAFFRSGWGSARVSSAVFSPAAAARSAARLKSRAAKEERKNERLCPA